MQSLTRRRALLALAAGAPLAACGKAASPSCATPAPGPAAPPAYCLVAASVLRVPAARRLQAGQALLLNVDDDTAVVVTRDGAGYYAMSAICTHQCCLLSLCNDAACTAPSTNPGECGTSPVESPGAAGGLVCPCHGSAFHLDGSVLSGPARTPLPHYALNFEGDDALVDTARIVPGDQRT